MRRAIRATTVGAVALLALLAGAAGARGEVLPGTVEVRPDLAQRTFALVNAYRTSLGLGALAWDDRLAAAAAWFAQDRVSPCQFDKQVEGDGTGRVTLLDGCVVTHRDSLGRLPWDRAAAFGFPPGQASENVVILFEESPEEALRQWQESPGHDRNQRNPAWAVGAAGAACRRTRGAGLGGEDLLVCYYVMMFGPAPEGGSGQASSPPAAPSRPASAGRPAGGGSGQAAVVPDPCAGRQAPAPPARRSVHRVEPGETLAQLAERYLGDAGRYCDLAAWSGIGPPYLLRVGQEVVVPAQEQAPSGDGRQREAQEAQEDSSPSSGTVERGASVQETPAPASHPGILPDRAVGDLPARDAGRSHPLLQLLAEIGRRLRKLWPF